MNKKEFLAQYQTKEWYEISKRIKARDNNTCQMCGCNNKPLSVHHLYYGENGSIFDVNDSSLITLCEDCHKKQKEYYSDVTDRIQDLKTILTDFELSIILNQLFWDITDDIHPIWVDVEPTKKYFEYLDEKEREDALRLLEWRKKVRLQECRKEVVKMYRSGFKHTDDLTEWFYRMFGEDLDQVAKNEEL